MKYRALPVEVEAYVIESVKPPGYPHEKALVGCSDGLVRSVDEGMTARYWPKEGDYWVIQDDGYAYLNPKDVFERKYAHVTDRIEPVVADDPTVAQMDTLRERLNQATEHTFGPRLGPQVAKAEGNPVQARYTLAVEITKAERRAEHLRTLLNALPRSFWERPGAEETIREVLGK